MTGSSADATVGYDIGVLEKDGRLRIVDRGNGLIISGGENVYAAEVERMLISHPQVRDVTVIGKPDPLGRGRGRGGGARARDVPDPA